MNTSDQTSTKLSSPQTQTQAIASTNNTAGAALVALGHTQHDARAHSIPTGLNQHAQPLPQHDLHSQSLTYSQSTLTSLRAEVESTLKTLVGESTIDKTLVVRIARELKASREESKALLERLRTLESAWAGVQTQQTQSVVKVQNQNQDQNQNQSQVQSQQVQNPFNLDCLRPQGSLEQALKANRHLHHSLNDVRAQYALACVEIERLKSEVDSVRGGLNTNSAAVGGGSEDPTGSSLTSHDRRKLEVRIKLLENELKTSRIREAVTSEHSNVANSTNVNLKHQLQYYVNAARRGQIPVPPNVAVANWVQALPQSQLQVPPPQQQQQQHQQQQVQLKQQVQQQHFTPQQIEQQRAQQMQLQMQQQQKQLQPQQQFHTHPSPQHQQQRLLLSHPQLPPYSHQPHRPQQLAQPYAPPTSNIPENPFQQAHQQAHSLVQGDYNGSFPDGPPSQPPQLPPTQPPMAPPTQPTQPPPRPTLPLPSTPSSQASKHPPALPLSHLQLQPPSLPHQPIVPLSADSLAPLQAFKEAKLQQHIQREQYLQQQQRISQEGQERQRREQQTQVQQQAQKQQQQQQQQLIQQLQKFQQQQPCHQRIQQFGQPGREEGLQRPQQLQPQRQSQTHLLSPHPTSSQLHAPQALRINTAPRLTYPTSMGSYRSPQDVLSATSSGSERPGHIPTPPNSGSPRLGNFGRPLGLQIPQTRRSNNTGNMWKSPSSLTPEVIDLTLDEPEERDGSMPPPRKRRRTDEAENREVEKDWSMSEQPMFLEINQATKAEDIESSTRASSYSLRPLALTPEVTPVHETADDSNHSMKNDHIQEISTDSEPHTVTKTIQTKQEEPQSAEDVLKPSDGSDDVQDNPDVSEYLKELFMSPEDDPSQYSCALCRMRHEDDPDAWPTVTVFTNPRQEEKIEHLKKVHGEVWKAISQDINMEEEQVE